MHSLNENTIGFLFASVNPTSWLSLPIAYEDSTEIRMQMYVEWFCPKVLADYCVLICTPHLADHLSYSWWRWWSDTLWATLIRLWPHSLLCYPQTVVKSFLCNLIDMLSVFPWEKWMWQAKFMSAFCVQIQTTWLCKSLLLPNWLVECSCIMWLLDINANLVFSCSRQLLMGLVDDRVPTSVWADGMGSLQLECTSRAEALAYTFWQRREWESGDGSIWAQ